MKRFKENKLLKCIALSMIVAGVQSSVIAQEEDASADNNEQSNIEEIIVTGTAGGTGIRKVDASFAISTLDTEDIIRFAPKSTADLFKAVPGVWAESSGGVSGANISLRGFPGTGDAPFVTIQVEGMPIYTPPSLSFLENSTIFRVDETIKRVEALRGGPNPVLSNGQPGLTTNFLLKEGSEDSEGIVKYTASDYSLQRLDAVLSGELADDLYYMIGGYIRSSEGVREAGFNAMDGNQFTLNITKKLDNGKANFYYRSTDDSGTWYLPVPLNVPGVDASYTQISSANRNMVVEGPFGEQLSADYGDGRGFDGILAGGSIEIEIADGWTLINKFNHLEGDADTLGLVPRGGPRTISELGLTTAETIISNRTLSAGDFVQHYGFWVVEKDIENLSNDLLLQKQFEGGSASFGYFASRFSADDLWNLNNNARYFELGRDREQVEIDCETIQNAPSDCAGGFRVNSRGDGRMDSFYASGDFQATEALRIDAGIRFVNHEITYVAETGGDPIMGLTGQSNINTEYDESGTSWTVGANYAIREDLGVFVRINDGFRLPYFDDIRGRQTQLAAGDDLIFDVEQFEVGLKYEGKNASAYLTAFMVDTQDSRSTTPMVGSPINVFETESTGLELDATYYTDFGVFLNLSATVLDGEITADPNTDLIGNQAPRQPELQIRFSPNYEFEAGDWFGSIYGAISHIGERFSNAQNTQPLDSFTKLDVGLQMKSEEGFTVQLAIDNLSDEQGLTEGDPRSFDINTNGRYILPRSVRVSIGHNF